MATPRAWPAILVPSDEEWNANNATSVSSGRGLDNGEQPVVGPTGYVSASLTVPCKTPAQVLAMRALIAGLDGRAGTVLVGPNETSRAPWHIDPITGGAITYATGARDAARDPGWATNADTTSVLDFRLAAAAALNATALTVQRVRGGVLQPGMYLSIANGLHVITDLTTVDSGAAGNVGLIVRPWLRADAASGAPVEFGRPLCLMRAARDDTGRMLLELARFATVTLDLVEA